MSSAGTDATRVRPEAAAVMAELGIDISAYESKRLDRFLGEAFDQVITVCDDAREACPFIPGARQMGHWWVSATIAIWAWLIGVFAPALWPVSSRSRRRTVCLAPPAGH